MTERSASFRAAWKLVRPYWVSEERWRGRGLLAAIVALALGQVYISVLINQWNNVFYNALQDKKLDVFLHQLVIFTGLAFAFIVIAVYRQYLNQMLHIKWRTWMTKHYQTDWLSERAYYRLQAIYKSTDNPDQRIADDIDSFTSGTLSLSIGLLSSVVTLVSFVTILWGLSGAYTLHLSGHEITIPGYMVWAALVYAIVGTWLTHRIGRPLVKLNVDQQRFEANYRFSLIRVREHAEGIAFYRGEPVEEHTLRTRFGDIIGNWWQIMRKQKQLNWFTSAYGQIAIIFPFVVAAPRYFSGAIPLGGLMQTASAFGQVQGALSWFIDVYPQYAGWKAATNRLHGFREMIALSHREHQTNSIIVTQQGDALTVAQLSLTLPSGTPLLNAIDLALKPGDRLLITGNSGCGKTTLLRAIAGLWPYGQGAITLPADASTLFIPQKPYLPNLRLRNAVAYPHEAAKFDDAKLIAVLTQVGLAHLTHSLDDVSPWSQSLSLGEQQKLAFARILLHRPALLLLDEATASLDLEAEATLYQLLLAELPQSIIVSVGHRASLATWHNREKSF